MIILFTQIHTLIVSMNDDNRLRNSFDEQVSSERTTCQPCEHRGCGSGERDQNTNADFEGRQNRHFSQLLYPLFFSSHYRCKILYLTYMSSTFRSITSLRQGRPLA